MNLRTKLLLIFAVLALLPLLAVSLLSYRAGLGAVEGLLRVRADQRAVRITRRIEQALDMHASQLAQLSKSESLREYVRDSQQKQSGAVASQSQAAVVPDTVRAHFGAFYENNRERLKSVSCLDATGRPLFRLPVAGADEDMSLQTTDFVSGEVRYDTRVWALRQIEALRSPVTQEPYGAALRVTVPVFAPSDAGDARQGVPMGAVVAEIRLEGLIEDAAETETPELNGAASDGALAKDMQPSNARPYIIALDDATDTIVYHTNGAFTHQSSATAMSYFADVAARMKSGEEGFRIYDEPGGGRRIAAFRQARGMGLSIAVAEDFAAAVGSVRRSGIFGVALALVAGLCAVALLLVVSRRERRDIERVTRGASAIAAGELDQRIEVSRSGETRELAENFNRMSDRLRELIAREAESRQFQSFVRISAMISHDLKNAIAGLSMLVANMERQFHREEFRADAIESLREATEKLKRTVARLSEPAKSMSGEHRLATRPTDLVPIIRRVLATNAEPSRPLYEVEAHLPDALVAAVEAERIENVVENLVINALEAMGSKGGRLTVEAGALDGELVFISVADTGLGMSEEFIKTRLFRPFSTTKNKGIGLGLFTCREIVETHGGRIEVESRAGAGTRFRVVLPSRLFKSGEQSGTGRRK